MLNSLQNEKTACEKSSKNDLSVVCCVMSHTAAAAPVHHFSVTFSSEDLPKCCILSGYFFVFPYSHACLS